MVDKNKFDHLNTNAPQEYNDIQKQAVIDLISNLVSFESDDKNGEVPAMEYIESYLRDKYGDSLKYIKQDIGDRGRYNLIVGNTESPDIILGGHIDVVPLSTKDQLQARVEGNRLYGRGTVDMKSGVGINISLIDDLLSNNKKFWNLFYCDEEYNFLGMKKFVDDYQGKINPKITVMTEPSDEKIVIGFRGVAEFDLNIKGRTSHSARKHLGINAINEFISFSSAAESYFQRQDKFGFTSSVNIGGINGGLDSEGVIKWKGNNVADIVNGLIEIRIGNNISQDQFESFMQDYFLKKNIEIKSYNMKFWLGPLLQNDLIDQYSKYAQTEVSLNSGYSDIQMIKEKLGGDCLFFGPSPNSKCHQSDEYVDIDSIFRVRDKLLQILTDIK